MRPVCKTGKVVHLTRQDAEDAADLLYVSAARKRVRTFPYECKFCRCFHLTRDRQRDQRIRR